MRRIGSRHQRTLARPAEVRGVGLITGARTHLRFHPAPPNTGLAFVRSDLKPRTLIPAHVDRVTGTARRTTIGHRDHCVTLVEHVLAALSGMRVDNCIVELDAIEPPGLDGSAFGFTEAIKKAETILQPAQRVVWAVTEPVFATHGGATIALYPPDTGGEPALRVNYILDYGREAVIPRQAFTMTVSPEAVMREVAPCRTFVLEDEVKELQRQGIGQHLAASDLLVFGPRGPIGNKLRFADEPARHKVLDLIGDLALSGLDLVGRVVAYRSGHALNVALAKRLAEVAARTIDDDLTVFPVPFPGRRRSA